MKVNFEFPNNMKGSSSSVGRKFLILYFSLFFLKATCKIHIMHSYESLKIFKKDFLFSYQKKAFFQ